MLFRQCAETLRHVFALVLGYGGIYPMVRPYACLAVAIASASLHIPGPWAVHAVICDLKMIDRYLTA